MQVEGLQNAVVAGIKNTKFEVNTEETEAAVNELAGYARGFCPTSSPQEWIEKMVEEVRVKKNAAQQNVQRMQKTAQGMSQVSDAEPAPLDAEHRLDVAKEWLRKSEAEVTRLAELGRLMKKQLDEANTAAAASSPDNQKAVEDELKAKESERGRLSNVPKPEPEAEAPMQASAETVRRLQELAAEKERLAMETVRDISPSDHEEAANERQADSEAQAANYKLMDAAREVKRLENEISRAGSEKTCSKCGQDVTLIQQRVTDTLKLLLKEAEATRDAAMADKDLKQTAAAKAGEQLSKARSFVSAWNTANTLLRTVQREHDDLQSKVRGDTHAAWQFRKDEYDLAQQQIIRLGEDIAKLRAKLEDKSAADAAARVPELTRQVEQARADWTAADATAKQKRTEVTTAEDGWKRLLGERAEAKLRAQAVKERQRAESELFVLKELYSGLLELQTKLVDRAVVPVIELANRLCGPILKRPLAYRDGEIGMEHPTGFASWKTFSGTERAMAFCALSVALAQDSPIKLVLIDEVDIAQSETRVMLEQLKKLQSEGTVEPGIVESIERCVQSNLEKEKDTIKKMLNLLCDLEADGTIDQAVVAHTTAPELGRDNYRRIEL
jgi:hypothetical protein